MKHPVDTSTWGEFKVGELFDVHPTKAYKLKNSDLLSVDGEIPVVVNSSYNNGIGGYSKLEPTEQPGILTFSDTTSGSNTLFYQNQAFIGYAHVQGMYPKKFELTDLTALFMIATLRATIDQRKWDYTNKLNRTTVIKMHVKLPLKQGTNLADYSQEDIDWDYMESFMSRVQDAAKERLANLPEPGQKSKTPVDVSGWGEFKVGDLFEFSGCKQVKSQHNLIETDKENGIPFVVQSNANNMVKCYVTKESLLSNNETIYDGNAIMLGVMTPVASYQEHEFGASQSIALRAEFLNPLRGLFIATIIKSVIEPKYNYANIPGIHKYKNETIPLPLKPGTNPSDYSQDDIDWDYMESFMSQFQTLAKNRVERLT